MPNSKIQAERNRAIRCLADDLYVLRRNAELAKFCSGDLIGDFFDEECPDGSPESTDRLLIGYLRAQAQANIFHDYICDIVEDLSELERISEEDVQLLETESEQPLIASSKALSAAIAAAADPALAHVIEQLAFKLTPETRRAAMSVIDELASASDERSLENGVDCDPSDH